MKAGYRAWFAMNNPWDASYSTFSLNGNLIQIVAMGLIILVCPLLIYCAETSKFAKKNDGIMTKIYAQDNLRRQLKPRGFVDSEVQAEADRVE